MSMITEAIAATTEAANSTVILAVISGGFALLSLIVQGIFALLMHKQGMKIEEIKKATDGLTSALVDATGRAEHAEGKESGRVAEQLRAASAPVAARRDVAAPPRRSDKPEPMPVKIIADANSPVPVETVKVKK